MKFTALALGLLPIVAAGGLGGAIYERAEGMSPKLDASMDEQARRAVDDMFEVGGIVARVAAPEPQASAPPNASTDGLPDQAQTNQACQSQLAKLNGQPSNPSGKSVCYNIAQMDTATGAFKAQVMIYDIGLPTGQWVGLLDKGEGISLTYPGGQVEGSPQKLPFPPNSNGTPNLNASLLFTGQLNSSMMNQMTNVDAMRKALTPQISITAETSDGQFLNTTMSNGEAAFINGLFSSQAFTNAQAEAAAANGTVFVLPGTTFGIFPVGFIVTGVWTILFTLAVGLGTYGRYQFRMSYRNRVPNRPRAAAAAPAAKGGAAYDKR